MKDVLLMVTLLVVMLALVAIGTLVSAYLAFFLFGVGAAVSWTHGMKVGVLSGRMWQVQRERKPSLFTFVAIIQGFTTLALIVVPILHWLGVIHVGSQK